MTHSDNIQKSYKDIDMPGGWKHNLVDRLKTNELYYLGKFKTGPYDRRGFRKFFLNVIHVACDIARKFIDLDTRDVRLVPERKGDEWAVWLMARQLKHWMKTTGFARFLNDLPDDFLKNGHVLVKAANGKVNTVALMNMRVEPQKKWLRDMAYFYEVHEWTRNKVEEIATKQALVDLDARISGEESYIVYEAYTRDGDAWTREYLADVFSYTEKGENKRSKESQINDDRNYNDPVVLKTEKVSKLPYYEEKFENVPGRWLGYGLVEYLEDNQIAINETDYLERKALQYKALQLWVTNDDQLGGQNALINAENGDFLLSQGQVSPLQKDNTDISAYNNSRNVWKDNTDQKAFTSEFVSNGTLPSRTPVGVVNVQAQFATAFFALKQEVLGILVKELLQEEVIPRFLKENAKEHTQVFLGSDDDISFVHQAIVRSKTNEMINDYEEKTGFAPSKIVTDDFKLQIQEQLNESTELFIDIPAETYANSKYSVDIIITDENVDIGAQTQVLSTALQIKNANPNLDQDPMAKAVLRKFLSLGGFSPVDFEQMNAAESLAQAQPQLPQEALQPGGSISQAPIPQ